MYGIPAASSGARTARPCLLYEPTTATTSSATACRAHFDAPIGLSASLQVSTRSSCPSIPPRSLIQRA